MVDWEAIGDRGVVTKKHDHPFLRRPVSSGVVGTTSPLLLGFDDLERALDKVSKTGADGYPPYNIERIAAEGGEPERLRITLAPVCPAIAEVGLYAEPSAPIR